LQIDLGFTSDASFEERVKWFALVLLLLNTVSAFAFIVTVNRPVFDDAYNMSDANRYYSEGISTDTVRRQINPTGPTSFIWMAQSMRLFGGDKLLDARGAVLASWLLLSCGLLLGARLSKTPELWYSALLASLTFPHTMTATATALTEGPALFLAAFGALLFVEAVGSPVVTFQAFAYGSLGGLLMGLAGTARQYYVALLPSMCVFTIYCHRLHRQAILGRMLTAATSVTLAAFPIGILTWMWGGFTSPGMATGASYANAQASLGLRFDRPGIGAFYTALYLVPLAYPVARFLTLAQTAIIATIAILIAAALVPLQQIILQPGPLQTFINTHWFPGYDSSSILFYFVTAAVIFNFGAFAHFLWQRRQMILDTPPAVFSAITIVLFICEQIAVGGNIPFYDRYILQIIPFMGILAFSLLRSLSAQRLVLFASLWVLSQYLLWRYCFG
jgi:hypothetical protein